MIKKVLYVILLLAELVLGVLLMSLVWVNIGWLPCVIAIAVWGALLAWQLGALKKNSDAVKARKIKRNIALIMLIPSAVYVLMILWLIICLFGVI